MNNYKIFFTVGTLLLILPIVGAESDNTDIRVRQVDFYFIQNFDFDSPLFKLDPYDVLTRDRDLVIDIKFNESYRKSIIGYLRNLSKSGEIVIENTDDAIVYHYKYFPQYRVFIYPNYVMVHHKIRGSNLTRSEYKKVYDDLEKFVDYNITETNLCFLDPFDKRFCPLYTLHRMYRQGKWIVYIEISDFTPKVNEENIDSFKFFHPFPYIEEVKTENRLRNYLFYFKSPRVRKEILVNFNPMEHREYLIGYLELIDIVFPNLEHQRLEILDEIRNTQTEINTLKMSLYLTNDKNKVKAIQRKLANITIDNSPFSSNVNSIEFFERQERQILQEMDDIFHLVYRKEISDHNTILSRDIEDLKDKISSLKRNHDDAIVLADSRIQFLEQREADRYSNRLSIIGAVLGAIVGAGLVFFSSIFWDRREQRKASEQSLSQMTTSLKNELKENKNMLSSGRFRIMQSLESADKLVHISPLKTAAWDIITGREDLKILEADTLMKVADAYNQINDFNSITDSWRRTILQNWGRWGQVRKESQELLIGLSRQMDDEKRVALEKIQEALDVLEKYNS